MIEMARIYYIGISRNIYSLSKSIKSARESAYIFAKLNPNREISVYDANPTEMEYIWEVANHTLGYAHCKTRESNVYWTAVDKATLVPKVHRLKKDGSLGDELKNVYKRD